MPRVVLIGLSLLSLLLLLAGLHLYPLLSPPVPLRLPDAVLFGVKKSGTEALRAILNQHPQLVVSRLVNFYDKNFHMGLEWYADKLPPVREDQLLIDRTPAYFTGGPEVPTRIHAIKPDTLLMVVVRDPVDRFVSDYLHWEDKQALGTTFHEFAFSRDPLAVRRVSNVTSRLDRSCYSRHLRDWMAVFPPGQMLVLNGDRLKVAPWLEIERAQRFLGVEQLISKRHFQLDPSTGFYCWRVSGHTATCLGGNKGRTHPVLSELELELLRDQFSVCNSDFRSQLTQFSDPPTFRWQY